MGTRPGNPQTFSAGAQNAGTVPEISNHNEATGITSHNLLLGQAASDGGKKKVDIRVKSS